MIKVEFPAKLEQLLGRGQYFGPIRTLADQVGVILADNQMPFFPNFTDHGIQHINSLLQTQEDLVPDIWEDSRAESKPRLLQESDAAIIIGSTLLHDLGMHIKAAGFKELVANDSRFRPLPWFRDPQEGIQRDMPWNELWQEFENEARRFNAAKLGDIVGAKSVNGGWKFEGLHSDSSLWTENDRLIVGEFIRRHHARLAHEIAHYGFPGLIVGTGTDQFPALGEANHPLHRLADLIGLTARSHGIALRVCQEYLRRKYPWQLQPMGSAVLYAMALLRVGDYLQIDQQRAPAVLLQLRNPQSPISIREWATHKVVEHIGSAIDPRGKIITVSGKISLEIFLQLEELLRKIQEEIDQSTAVLDEFYGTHVEKGLNRLGLSIRRIHSNFYDPGFRASLPYVAERTGFSSDPNLLSLLVEPLYGKYPSVGIRELIQNSVDAVRELKVWCENHSKDPESLDLPRQEADVYLEYFKEGGKWKVMVRDKGLGMKPETIQKYFLRAGASFRRSSEWRDEFVGGTGEHRVARSGRFGVGVFAIFLIGNTFRLMTRHASAGPDSGYSISASADDNLIEIRRESGLKVGTTIEVALSDGTVEDFKFLKRVEQRPETDWYCWSWPKVSQSVNRNGTLVPLPQEHEARIEAESGLLPPEWSAIKFDGYDGVFWTFTEFPRLTCNGLRISHPKASYFSEFTVYWRDAEFGWPPNVRLKAPSLAILDRSGSLPLTIQRYGLTRMELPFIDELLADMYTSVIAHGLVCGPIDRRDTRIVDFQHPLCPDYYGSRGDYADDESFDDFLSDGWLRWIVTEDGMVPADPWLYKLLNTDSCLLVALLDEGGSICDLEKMWIATVDATSGRTAILFTHLILRSPDDDSAVDCATVAMRAQSFIVQNGIPALGANLLSAAGAISSVSVLLNGELARRSPGSELGRQRSFYGDTANMPLDIASLLSGLENCSSQKPRVCPKSIFLAHISVEASSSIASATLLGKVWARYMRLNPIPFDSQARQNLIAEGKLDPIFKRHLDAWENMRSCDED